MALTLSSGGGGARIRCSDLTVASRKPFVSFRIVHLPYPSRTRYHVVTAAKKASSPTGRFDSKKRRSLVPTTTKEQSEEQDAGYNDEKPPSQVEDYNEDGGERFVVNTDFRGDPADAPKFLVSDLPGLETDFWEGEQWDVAGFVGQYLWAFGIVFALISGGIAVATYNEGATDFKETPVYKEAIQSRDLLDEAERSNSEDVFESNPTEVAPSVE